MKYAKLIDNKTIQVRFSFPKGEESQFMETLNAVRGMPGRKFISHLKAWNIPLSHIAVEMLIKAGFDIDTKIQDNYISLDKALENKQAKKISLKFPDELSLYKFQRAGVEFIERNDGKALIADQMGLGKTIQALAWLFLHPEKRPAVIICPASLKLNWLKESTKWLNMKKENITIWSGRNGTEKISKATLNIINYDIVSDRLDEIKKIKPAVVILDECHYIKNQDAIRTKAVKEIAKSIKHIIALSGTPIINKPIEFFSVLNLLDPITFPGRWNYAMRYCNPKHNGYGWNFNGTSNTEELHNLLKKTVMIRRLKKDVLKDLPEKAISVVPIEVDVKNYKTEESRVFKNLKEKEQSSMNILAEMEYLKQLSVDIKIDSCVKWIEDFIESGEKLVVFATHHSTIDFIKSAFDKISVKLDGRDSMENKERAVAAFQNDDNIRLFIGNIKAAGVGITLTAASSTCFIELGWTPGEHEQAEDRVHRIGQEADSVNAYYLIANNTIENEIMDLLDSKRKVLDAVLDGRQTEASSLLTELLNKIKGETL